MARRWIPMRYAVQIDQRPKRPHVARLSPSAPRARRGPAGARRASPQRGRRAQASLERDRVRATGGHRQLPAASASLSKVATLPLMLFSPSAPPARRRGPTSSPVRAPADGALRQAVPGPAPPLWQREARAPKKPPRARCPGRLRRRARRVLSRGPRSRRDLRAASRRAQTPARRPRRARGSRHACCPRSPWGTRRATSAWGRRPRRRP